MDIKPDDITWNLFEECSAYNDKNVDNNDPRITMHVYERHCSEGLSCYPVPDGLTKKGKKKYKWVAEPCSFCKGSGYRPSAYARAFAKMLGMLLKYDDPNVTKIDANELPWEFIPRKGWY